MTSLVGKNIGNYQVVAQIGQGGMGAVYLGQHPTIGKRVAVKVLHEELSMKEDIVSRFFTEAKAVNSIQHPNIVDIVDFGKIPGENGLDMVYLIMEFLDGEGLDSRLKREGVSINEAVHILTQCASALSASHAHHIVHRDLKPENIYLVKRGQDRNYCKLLDFGIAKLTGDDAAQSKHQTRAGLVIGTPAYMSPEQCEGKGNIDWRSDVYSLGIVMYEMITGRTPFQGDGFGEVLVAHLTKTPPLPSSIRHDIPPGMESVVMHALEKNKDARFQSMEEFTAAMADPNAHLASYGSPSGRTVDGAGTMMLDSQPRTGGTGAYALITGHGAGQRPITGQANMTAMVTPGTPTTLSGASGEVAQGTRQRSRGLLFGAVGAGVAAAGLAAYFLVLDKPPQLPLEVVQVAPPPKPKKVFTSIKVDSQPKGAKAFRAGVTESVGITPFELRVKSGEPEFDLLLKLDGFQDQTKTVSTERDHDMLLSLAPSVVPVAVAPPPGDKKSGTNTGTGAATTPAGGTAKPKSGFKPVSDKKKDKDGVLEPSF
ncbi:MAG: serine/threonine protein kinase [Myxococcales bacterium]|nr:serine/threonine protein kinase [Myxococcales bacterium]